MTKKLLWTKFPLFQSHLDLAHDYWKRLVHPGDWVIDATCGNGHDTLMLAHLALSEDEGGSVIAIDTQINAIEATRELLKTSLPENLFNQVKLLHQCHSSFPNNLEPASIRLIVYNLGYLPGGNKDLTTMCQSTLQSLHSAIHLIRPGGAISVTCYPGHLEGKPEEEEVIKFSSTLNPREWNCCRHHWSNRQNAPSLIIIQKTQ